MTHGQVSVGMTMAKEIEVLVVSMMVCSIKYDSYNSSSKLPQQELWN